MGGVFEVFTSQAQSHLLESELNAGSADHFPAIGRFREPAVHQRGHAAAAPYRWSAMS
jgi:hypothetical protein